VEQSARRGLGTGANPLAGEAPGSQRLCRRSLQPAKEAVGFLVLVGRGEGQRTGF